MDKATSIDGTATAPRSAAFVMRIFKVRAMAALVSATLLLCGCFDRTKRMPGTRSLLMTAASTDSSPREIERVSVDLVHCARLGAQRFYRLKRKRLPHTPLVGMCLFAASAAAPY